ncbi:acyl--CoA ligase [Natronomonas gomsonensis]|uniref:class I adenylate-forming enzyme family protein n=1 Tax=Natronomonas gomsonensis TaxID=1046043 RepID=UPI0020CA6876|nr:class I adenylate-forming enzyme family protein [Natronomonas gomsonensis]MCY4729912.1 acyl--CoA ligase [Natronomonas gomsonensis]
MLEWPEATIYQGLTSVAASAPSSLALIFEDETTTYGELVAESRRLARALAALDVGVGDTIAIWLRNRPAWIEAQLAASYLGASVVAVNTRCGSRDLDHVLNDAGVGVVLTEPGSSDPTHLEMLASLAPGIVDADLDAFSPDRYPDLSHVVTTTAAPGYDAVRSLQEMKDMATAAPTPDPVDTPAASACVFYTSGTTGDSKGCPQSNRSLLNHSYQVGEHFDLSSDDVALGALPFCGIMGHNTFLSALAHGIPLVLQPEFDAAAAIDLIETHEVTYFSAIGSMYERMVVTEEFTSERVTTLSKGAVAFVSGTDRETFERVEGAVGFPLVRPYGLSEANSQVFVGDPDATVEERFRTGGPPVHPDEEAARVVDPETGDPLPTDEQGELCLRGYNVIDSYLGRPEATAAAVDEDGWFHTGDLAERGPDGVYYHARMDDALRVRGFLVAPRAVERAVESHPAVDAAQVVGAPHPRHGQVPVAFVTGEDADETAVREFLVDRLADYKVPERVFAVASFPRTDGPHGRKIQKHELRDRVETLFEG